MIQTTKQGERKMKVKLVKSLTAAFLAIALTACSASTASNPFKAGTYQGTAAGRNGDVTVEVKLSESKIESVTVTQQQETKGIADPALEKIPQAIVDQQSLAVDVVSGATITSTAIINASEEAIKSSGADTTALKQKQAASAAAKTERKESTDVLILGAGIAGLTSAISAAESGAKVTIIEKQSSIGGTAAISGGYLIAVESELYKDSGVDDSFETFKTYWNERMAVSGVTSGYPDDERWTNMIKNTGKTVDWLASIGIQFDQEIFKSFGPYPVAHDVADGPGLVDQLKKACEDKGVKIITDCKATSLVMDGSTVVGAVGETATEKITFSASSVILATGGISQNEELVQKYSPKVTEAGTQSRAASGSTGDGMQLALDAGADDFDEFFTAIWATEVDPELVKAVPDASTLSTVNQLGINAEGQRFGNEAPVFVDALGSDMIQNGKAPFYFIFDSSDAATTKILEDGVAAGRVFKADTINDLADKLKINGDTLKATYDSYEAMAAAGVDAEFNKPAANLKKLEKAPYYAVQYVPTTFGSTGGVKTDEQGHVLNNNGEIIKGLFAAGEMSNRYYYNENYVLGASLSFYSTVGRTVGTVAAQK